MRARRRRSAGASREQIRVQPKAANANLMNEMRNLRQEKTIARRI